MRNTEEFIQEINGNEYKIFVTEYAEKRDVTVVDVERNPDPGHILIRDEREETSGGLFGDPEPLPPRSDHVADAINTAVARKESRVSETETMREEVRVVLEATEEAWSQN